MGQREFCRRRGEYQGDRREARKVGSGEKEKQEKKMGVDEGRVFKR